MVHIKSLSTIPILQLNFKWLLHFFVCVTNDSFQNIFNIIMLLILFDTIVITKRNENYRVKRLSTIVVYFLLKESNKKFLLHYCYITFN